MFDETRKDITVNLQPKQVMMSLHSEGVCKLFSLVSRRETEPGVSIPEILALRSLVLVVPSSHSSPSSSGFLLGSINIISPYPAHLHIHTYMHTHFYSKTAVSTNVSLFFKNLCFTKHIWKFIFICVNTFITSQDSCNFLPNFYPFNVAVCYGQVSKEPPISDVNLSWASENLFFNRFDRITWFTYSGECHSWVEVTRWDD